MSSFSPSSLPTGWCARRRGRGAPAIGLLEARLTESDRVMLGGFVEGAWPPESRTDAWLSRPMRLELGLDLPERRIGLWAHDFASCRRARGDPRACRRDRRRADRSSRLIQRLAAIAGRSAGRRWSTAATSISAGRAGSTAGKDDARATPGAEAPASRAA